MDVAKRIIELREGVGENRKEFSERIFDTYGDTCPHIRGLGGGETHSAGIYSTADRVSNEV